MIPILATTMKEADGSISATMMKQTDGLQLCMMKLIDDFHRGNTTKQTDTLSWRP